MGDYCYMEITCRKQDRARFTALGFTAQDWKQDCPELVVMVEEEADYAHSGNIPTDIPYHGFNGPAGNYGQGVVACNGKSFAEVETGHGGGFVVDWNEAKHRPSAQSLKNIRRYLKIHKKVLAMFKDLATPTTPPTLQRG